MFLLVSTRRGPRLIASSDQEAPDAAPSASPGDGPPRGGALTGPGFLMANAATIASLARLLRSELGRPVIDRTNLKGRFDITLKWATESQSVPSADGADSDRAYGFPRGLPI